MDTTATINLMNITKSEQAHIVRHNSRDNQTYENQDIDLSKSHLNVYKKYNDEDELLKNHYQDYIDERNGKLDDDFSDKKISLEQYTTRKQTLSQYLQGSNGTKEKKAYTDIVATVGNAELLDEFRKKIPDDKWQEYFVKVYDLTAKRIDKLDGFSVANLHVHFDEAGMPHGHIDAINNGMTAAGKPSTTLNSALKLSYGNKDSRQNLRQLRDELDSGMIDDCNAVAQDMGIDLPLKLVRLGTVGGKTMKEYKTLKQHEDDLEGREKRLGAIVGGLDKREQEVDQREQEVDKKNQEVLKKQQELASQQEFIKFTQRSAERELKEREKRIKEKEEQQAKTDEQQAKTEERLKKWEERLNNIKSNVGQLIVSFRSDLLRCVHPDIESKHITFMAVNNIVPSGKLKETVFQHVLRVFPSAGAKAKDNIVKTTKTYAEKDQSNLVDDEVTEYAERMQKHSYSAYSSHKDNDLER